MICALFWSVALQLNGRIEKKANLSSDQTKQNNQKEKNNCCQRLHKEIHISCGARPAGALGLFILRVAVHELLGV
jgi:hypothetical protein